MIALNKNKKGLFLDVGAGFGYFSKEAKENDLNVVSLELGNFESKALKELWDINAVNIFFEDFTDDEEKYSYILMSQVLEHTLEPEYGLKKLLNYWKQVVSFALLFRILILSSDIF